MSTKGDSIKCKFSHIRQNRLFFRRSCYSNALLACVLLVRVLHLTILYAYGRDVNLFSVFRRRWTDLRSISISVQNNKCLSSFFMNQPIIDVHRRVDFRTNPRENPEDDAIAVSSDIWLRLNSAIATVMSSSGTFASASKAADSCRDGSRVSGTTAVAPAFSKLTPCSISWALTKIRKFGKALFIAQTAL